MWYCANIFFSIIITINLLLFHFSQQSSSTTSFFLYQPSKQQHQNGDGNARSRRWSMGQAHGTLQRPKTCRDGSVSNFFFILLTFLLARMRARLHTFFWLRKSWSTHIVHSATFCVECVWCGVCRVVYAEQAVLVGTQPENGFLSASYFSTLSFSLALPYKQQLLLTLSIFIHNYFYLAFTNLLLFLSHIFPHSR